MDNEKVELVSSKKSPTGVAGTRVNGIFTPRNLPQSTVITPESVAKTSPINLSVAPAPSQSGEVARFESLADTTDKFVSGLTTNRESSETAAVDSLSSYINALTSSPTLSELEAEAYQGEGGVDELGAELTELNNQLRGEQHALLRKVEKLEKNTQGLSSDQLADVIDDAERESLRKQADISIVQMAKQGRYDSAKAIADRAINATFEKQEQRLQALSLVYNFNKDLFDKDEQREFEVMQADRERRLETKKEEEKLLSDTRLAAMQMAQMNGAPSSVLNAIQSATTPEEVLVVGGQYASVDMLDRALKSEQLHSLRNKPAALRPTSVIDQGGRKLLIDTQSGEVIKDFGMSSDSTTELQKMVDIQGVQQVSDLRSHKGLNSSVGAVGLGRIALTDVFGAKDDFIAGIDNLTKDLTLDNLIRAKEAGATFGALSNAELGLLAESATKINNWRFGERGAGGEIIETKGYDASEKDFKAELDRIAYFRALDAKNKGATAEELGLATTPDGKTWFKNSDGTVIEI